MESSLLADSPLHVRDLGAGPGVILLHAGIVTGEAWLPVALQVAETGRRVLVPDLRGFGRSPDPDPDRTLIDDVLDIADAAALESFVVVGWSMGGAVAMDVALEVPDRVSGLGLVCAVPSGMERSEGVMESWAREDALEAAGDTDGVVRNDLVTWVAGAQRTLADVDEAVVTQVRRALESYSVRPESEHEWLELDTLASERYGEVACPVLTVVGELDWPDARDASALLREPLANVTEAVIEGSAHVPPLEHPDETAAAILGWLDDIDW